MPTGPPAPPSALAFLGGHCDARKLRHTDSSAGTTIGPANGLLAGVDPANEPLPLTMTASAKAGASHEVEEVRAAWSGAIELWCRSKATPVMRLLESATLRLRKTREPVVTKFEPAMGSRKLARRASSTRGEANDRAAPAMQKAQRGGARGASMRSHARVAARPCPPIRFSQPGMIASGIPMSRRGEFGKHANVKTENRRLVSVMASMDDPEASCMHTCGIRL